MWFYVRMRSEDDTPGKQRTPGMPGVGRCGWCSEGGAMKKGDMDWRKPAFAFYLLVHNVPKDFSELELGLKYIEVGRLCSA